MKKRIFEITGDGIRKVAIADFDIQQLNQSSFYIYNIECNSRSEADGELADFGLGEEILSRIQKPSENIRFEYVENMAYGELAYFSPSSKTPLKYLGTISYKNILFLFHESEEKLTKVIVDALYTTFEQTEKKIEVGEILYIIILEVLTSHGKLILSYREEVEDIARDLDHNEKEFDADEFLDSKRHLSDFGRAFEKLHFSLSFPPARSILNSKSPYLIYFKELLKNIDLLKISLSETEDRLDSLHDHYQLLLQKKANKRLNFLTIIQAIFVPLTLLAGIYGMNFKNMPELEWQYGYFASLGLMGIISLVFLRYFYKHGWFD
jgi:magnesium transporter